MVMRHIPELSFQNGGSGRLYTAFNRGSQCRCAVQPASGNPSATVRISFHTSELNFPFSLRWSAVVKDCLHKDCPERNRSSPQTCRTSCRSSCKGRKEPSAAKFPLVSYPLFFLFVWCKYIVTLNPETFDECYKTFDFVFQYAHINVFQIFERHFWKEKVIFVSIEISIPWKDPSFFQFFWPWRHGQLYRRNNTYILRFPRRTALPLPSTTYSPRTRVMCG